MKRIITLIVLDAKLTVKNIFFWITFVMFAAIIITVHLMALFEANQIPAQCEYLSGRVELLPFHERIVPIFICFEALTAGMMLSGALLLTEKSQKTLQAYQVSPSGTVSYIIAKTLFLSAAGTTYSFLIALLTLGLTFPLGRMLLLSFLSSALFTIIGIIIAIFVRSVSNWIMMLAFILGSNMLTLFSYLYPAVPIKYMKLLPAYPVLFQMEQILFAGRVGTGLGAIVLWLAVSIAICYIAVKYVLLRPQKEG